MFDAPFRKYLYPKRTVPPINLLLLKFLFDAYCFKGGTKAAISLKSGTTASFLLQYQIYSTCFDIFTQPSILERKGSTKFAKIPRVLSDEHIQTSTLDIFVEGFNQHHRKQQIALS